MATMEEILNKLAKERAEYDRLSQAEKKKVDDDFESRAVKPYIAPKEATSPNSETERTTVTYFSEHDISRVRAGATVPTCMDFKSLYPSVAKQHKYHGRFAYETLTGIPIPFPSALTAKEISDIETSNGQAKEEGDDAKNTVHGDSDSVFEGDKEHHEAGSSQIGLWTYYTDKTDTRGPYSSSSTGTLHMLDDDDDDDIPDLV